MPACYQNFVDHLNNNVSRATKQVYLERFADFMQESHKPNADQFEIMGANDFENLIKDYIDSKARQNKSYSYLNQAVSAFRAFAVANRIRIDHDWIYSKVPKPDKAGTPDRQKEQDNPYTNGQINAVIKACKYDPRPLTSIAIMALGGARIGALPDIRIEDIQLVEKYGLYAIKGYAMTTAAYWIILPPFVNSILQAYIGKRDKGFLFYTKHESDPKKHLYPRASRGGLISEIWRLSLKAKVRAKNDNGDTMTRHRNMLDHGFRKWHSTALEKAGLRDDHIARLRGNKKGLKGIYQLPTPQEVIELTGYMQAVPLLSSLQFPISYFEHKGKAGPTKPGGVPLNGNNDMQEKAIIASINEQAP